MIAANSTDGLASVLDVGMLEDDRHYFPPYECAIVVREDSLARVPGLEKALVELSGKLPDAVMRKRRRQREKQYRHIADHLGEDTLRLWYVDYPLRYGREFFARVGIEVDALDATVERELHALSQANGAAGASH